MFWSHRKFVVKIKKNSSPNLYHIQQIFKGIFCIGFAQPIKWFFYLAFWLSKHFKINALPMSHKIQGNNWFQPQEVFKWLKNGKVMREKLTPIFPDFWVASHTLQLRFRCSKKNTTKLQKSIISEGDFSLGVWQISCIFRLIKFFQSHVNK